MSREMRPETRKLSYHAMLTTALALMSFGLLSGTSSAETPEQMVKTCGSLGGIYNMEYTGGYSCVLPEGYARNCSPTGNCLWVDIRGDFKPGPTGGTNPSIPPGGDPRRDPLKGSAAPVTGGTASGTGGGTIVRDHRHPPAAPAPGAPPPAAAPGAASAPPAATAPSPTPVATTGSAASGTGAGTIVRDHRHPPAAPVAGAPPPAAAPGAVSAPPVATAAAPIGAGGGSAGAAAPLVKPAAVAKTSSAPKTASVAKTGNVAKMTSGTTKPAGATKGNTTAHRQQ